MATTRRAEACREEIADGSRRDRTVMGSGGMADAAGAGYRVGYDDPAHFNREYKRMFGAPPMRDVERLRGTASSG